MLNKSSRNFVFGAALLAAGCLPETDEGVGIEIGKWRNQLSDVADKSAAERCDVMRGALNFMISELQESVARMGEDGLSVSCADGIMDESVEYVEFFKNEEGGVQCAIIDVFTSCIEDCPEFSDEDIPLECERVCDSSEGDLSCQALTRFGVVKVGAMNDNGGVILDAQGIYGRERDKSFFFEEDGCVDLEYYYDLRSRFSDAVEQCLNKIE